MGVDAKMFIRIKAGTITADELAALGRRARAEFPRDIFREKDPLRFVETVGEYRASLEREGVEPDPQADGYDDDAPYWDQDGLPVVGEVGEQFVEALLWFRYYSPTYPRGPWPRIEAVADWLERAFPSGELWYGGDSSGELAYPLTAEIRAQYREADANNPG